ncbi:hypothetical protein ACI784_03470 [Geodermatophilus sp. SYSU D01186]
MARPDLETRLRQGLHAAADDVPPAPYDLADRVRQRARTQRRARLAVGAAGLVAAAVLVGVPVGAATLLGDRPGGQVAAPSGAVPPETSRPLTELPTRGSLAGDADWLAGVRALPWTTANSPEGAPDPAVAERRVTFAGDVPGARVALVLAGDAPLVAAWFVGPEGADPGQMTLAAPPAETTAQHPLALMDAPDPAAAGPTLVVVTWPGDGARLLTGRTVTADGTATEQWLPVPLTDGAGAIAAPGPATWPLEAQLRVDRTGGSYEPALTVADRVLDGARAVPDVADPRGLRGSVRDEDLRSAVEALAGYYGVPTADLRTTLLAAGPVGDGSPSATVLVGATFPSGATTAAQVIVWDDGTGPTSQVALTEVAPAGTPLLEQVLAVPASVPGDVVVTVSGPSSATVADVLGADGGRVARFGLPGGAGSGPVTGPLDGATVRLLDADGALVAEGRLTEPPR